MSRPELPPPHLPEMRSHSVLGPWLRRWLLPTTVLALLALALGAAAIIERYDLGSVPGIALPASGPAELPSAEPGSEPPN